MRGGRNVIAEKFLTCAQVLAYTYITVLYPKRVLYHPDNSRHQETARQELCPGRPADASAETCR